MFNPVIIVVILIQAFVARKSRIAGAVIGFLLTTGILIWGLSVYGEGNQIAFFGIPFSEGLFLVACLVWYGLDAREFMAARKVVPAAPPAVTQPGALPGAQTVTAVPAAAAPIKLSLPVIGLFWVLITVVGNFLWSPLYSRLNPHFSVDLDAFAAIASYAVMGMIIGVLQWLLLGVVIPNVNRRMLGWWVPATVVGWTMESIIYNSVQVPKGMTILVSILSGVTMGLLQWLLLRRYSELAAWWIPACILDSVGVMVLGLSGVFNSIGSLALWNLLFGVFGSITTGVALVLILRKIFAAKDLEKETFSQSPGF